MDKPFWEKTYKDKNVSTFSKGPTTDLDKYAHIIPEKSLVLDIGCGEGRNSIYLAKQGHTLEGFDLSEAGIEKAKAIAKDLNLEIKFWTQDIKDFVFTKKYDVILSHGMLHLPEKEYRDKLIINAQENTKIGGLNFISIFTNRLPATPDNAPFTKSLFDVGELPEKYNDWEIIYHVEDTFSDEHPGGIKHDHAYETVIARKIKD